MEKERSDGALNAGSRQPIMSRRAFLGAAGGVADILLHAAIPEPPRAARPRFTAADFAAPLAGAPVQPSIHEKPHPDPEGTYDVDGLGMLPIRR